MRQLFIFMATTILAVGPLAAQAPRVERLTTPKRTFPEPFSTVSGVRQLADGRLMIADRLEQAVRIIDLATGAMRDLGRVGSGPGEYQLPGGLLPLPGDSTVLTDLGNMRLTVIAPNGRMGRSAPLVRGEGQFMRPTAADDAGGLYFDQGGVRMSTGGQMESPESAPIQRWDVATDAIDTVAMLPLPKVETSTIRGFSSSGGGFQLRGNVSPLAAQDVWAVAPDGRVAIVHAEPYRVEWVSRSGATRVGPVVAYTPVPVTDEDKEAWADRMGQGTAVMLMAGGTGGGGGQSIRMPRPDPDEMDWPDVKPAFPRQAATVSPDGELWVQRHVAHGAPARYDVFDATGARVRQVEFPKGRQLAGFGRGVVYLVRVDEDDLQWLEEYVIAA
jgi:hypothetical protein